VTAAFLNHVFVNQGLAARDTIPNQEGCILATSTPAPSTSPLDQLYNAIKAQELQFPIPQASVTVNVGSFDAKTGEFHYLVPTYTQVEIVTPPSGKGPPARITRTGGEVNLFNALDLKLGFDVIDQQGLFTASIEGIAQASSATNRIVLDAGPAATGVHFVVSCGGKEFVSALPLKIVRPVAGAGVFTVPALPLTIIYAPPVDQQKKNVASWTESALTGNTTTFTFSQQDSTTQPATPSFQGTSQLETGAKDLVTALSVAASLVSPTGDAAKGIKIASALLGTLATLFGTSTATQTDASTTTNQNALTLTLLQTDIVSTSANSGGPGSGDVVCFLKNVRVAWLANGGPAQLAVLGWDSFATVTTAFLQSQGSQTGLDSATIAALLALDPFVAGGPEANLPPSRFVQLPGFELAGNAQTHTVTYTVTQTDTEQTVQSTTNSESDTAGLLGFLGIGVTSNQTTQTTVSQTSASQATQTQTLTRQVVLNAAATEIYGVDVFCDVVFGTFAFRQAVLSPAPKLSGKVLDKVGHPVPNSLVTLVNNKVQVRTQTNSAGEFAFRWGAIANGMVQLSANGATLEVAFSGAPFSGLEIKPK